jgi:hypothetical protein
MVRQRRAVLTNFLIDHPVWCSIERLNAAAVSPPGRSVRRT